VLLTLNLVISYTILVLISYSVNGLKYYQSKLYSLILLSLISYIVAHIISYKLSFYSILVIFIIVSLINIYKMGSEVIRWIDLEVELTFLITFSYFLFLRWLNPDIFGAEKFMDCAFISSILKSPNLPPFDPFLSGYRLNCYYYFGHVIGASITLMSFLPVQYGYNIAISAIAAYSASTLYGFLKDIGMKRAWLGVIFTLFSGDLYGFYELIKDLFTIHKISWLYYWNATRVIPGTINEFPYFSFLHADFHAHVVAIPLFILSLSILYSLFNDENREAIYAAVILSYVLYVTNSWDSPVFLFIFLILALKKKKLIPYFILSVFSAFLAYKTIKSASALVHLVKVHTPIIPFLLYFSIPIIYSYVWLSKTLVNSKKLSLLAVAIFTSLFIFLLEGITISIILLPILALSILSREEFLGTLVITACIFTLLPEFIAIDCRMNTVFKFYEISWILFSIPGSIALENIIYNKNYLINKDKILKNKILKIVQYALIFLFLTTLIYPVIATPQKCAVKRCTLNGMAFTKEFGEYKALIWAQKNVKGVIMSCAYKCYSYGGRFAAFTGNSVVIGWACHEVQWRGMAKMLGERILDVKLFYENPVKYKEILKKYNVSYVILGYEEKKVLHARESEFKFLNKLLYPVYSSKEITIYKVR